jgi:arylsulfatase A-like enzyme
MADDLGYADVSSYGQRDYATPKIDRLAIEGLDVHTRLRELVRLFGDANGTGDRTAVPLRPTMRRSQTARYGEEYRLAADPPTLPSLLQKAGYGTTLVGNGISDFFRSSVH